MSAFIKFFLFFFLGGALDASLNRGEDLGSSMLSGCAMVVFMALVPLIVFVLFGIPLFYIIFLH